MAQPRDHEEAGKLAVGQLKAKVTTIRVSLKGDFNGAAGIESGKVSWPWTQMKSKAHSRKMLMALPGDREWESQMAVDID